MHPRRFGVPCHVCDGKGTLSKSFCYGLPHNTAWLFLKEADLTPAQWKPDIQQGGAQPQQSGEGGTIGDTPKKTPEEEMREKESDHNMTVNNPATQEWFTGLLPDAVDFRQKLLSTVQAPGTALHDPNYKTNVKPMEKTGNELDKLIAHMRSMHSDTPGPGRGTMGNGATKPKNSAAAEFQRQFMDQGGD